MSDAFMNLNDRMPNWYWCNACRTVHSDKTAACGQKHAWSALGQFSSRDGALTQAKYVGFSPVN